MRARFAGFALLAALFPLSALGCTPERPPPQVTPPADETRGPSPTREPLPASDPSNDSHPDDSAPNDSAAPGGSLSTTPASPQLRVHDRLLAKPLDPAVDLDALKATLEAKTGARVKEIRKGALGLITVVFEPTEPPRTEEEQRALVEQVQAIGGFKYVEPDRLMQAK